jgi:hypothetical protein
MWSRMSGVAALPAAMAAGLGLASILRPRADDVPHRLARVAHWLPPLVLVLALADQVTWPRRLAWPPATFDPAMPAPMADAIDHLSPGAIFVLPLGSPPEVREHALGIPDRFLLWQLQHRRPITAPEISEGVAPLVKLSPLAHAVHALGLSREGRHQTVLDPRLVACAPAWAADLHAAGLAGILLVPDDPADDPIRTFLGEIIGPPTFDRAGVVAWDLARLVPRANTDPSEPACSTPHLKGERASGAGVALGMPGQMR